jgi:hypothetical protein
MVDESFLNYKLPWCLFTLLSPLHRFLFVLWIMLIHSDFICSPKNKIWMVFG